MENQTDNPLKKIFIEALIDEFYGYHLFEKESEDAYFFQPDEMGDSVWIIPTFEEDPYKARLFGTEVKRGQTAFPKARPFEHFVSFERDIQNEARIEKIIREGGTEFARKINKCFIEVLLKSISNSIVQKQDDKLERFLAKVADELADRRNNADRLLFPKKFKNRLVLEVVEQDNDIKNAHYVGTTKTGLKAFWSSELPDDVALVFDSTAGVILDPQKSRLSRFWSEDSKRVAFDYEVGGQIKINLIVKDVQSIIPIAISESRFDEMEKEISLSTIAKEIAELLYSMHPQYRASAKVIQETIPLEEDDCQKAIIELIDEELAKDFAKSDNTHRISEVELTPKGRRAVRNNFMRQEGEVTIVKNMTRHEKTIQIGDGAQVSAPIVIADSIENSFNTLKESDVNDDVKQLLEQLLQAVTEVNRQVPQDSTDDAEAMARDAETLVKEVASSKPRRQWYEVSLNGLEQAAINIGKIAVPVLTIVKQLASLLLE